VILRALKQISKSSTANVPVNINKTQPNRFLFWPFFQQISRLQEPSTTYPSPTLTPSPTTRRQGLSAIGFLNLCRTRSRSHTQDLPGSVPQGPGAIPWPHGGFLSLFKATNFGYLQVLNSHFESVWEREELYHPIILRNKFLGNHGYHQN
jgi:hypothetical protein